MGSSTFAVLDASPSGGDVFGDRSVVGGLRLFSIVVSPNYAESTDASDNPQVNGTIRFYDLNDAGDAKGTDLVLEIPQYFNKGYPVNNNISIGDEDGYVEFQNGIYIEDTTAGVSGTTRPMLSLAMTLFYQK
jgi:hypothetical protein